MSLLGNNYHDIGTFGLALPAPRYPKRSIIPSTEGRSIQPQHDQTAYQVTRQRMGKAKARAQAYQEIRTDGMKNFGGFNMFVAGTVVIFVAFMLMRSSA